MELTQIALNWAFTLVGALAGFVMKAMWDALTSMRKDLASLQDSISTNYVRRDDFKDHFTRVEKLLDRIYAKLDGKADKP